MTKAAFDPWAEQDAYDKAMEKGAVYTCPRSGWKFKVRPMFSRSPLPQKAAAIVMARPENVEVSTKIGKGEKLTAEEEAIREAYILEIAVRSTLMGWSGVTGRDGKKLEFNLQNAMTVFGSLKRLKVEVENFSSTLSNFGLAAESTTAVPDRVDAAGNSSGTSDTTSEDSADS